MSRVERWNSGVDSALGVVRHFVVALMDAFEDCFASVAIPGADAAVAILAAQNMVKQLGFSLAVSVITAISLEGVALVANRAALRCRYYNQTHKDEPPTLEALAWGLLGLNFALGVVLVVVNTVWVGAMTWGVISVAFLGSIGTLAHVIENDVKAREVGAKPAATVAPKNDKAADLAQDLAQPVIIEQPATTRERVLRYVEDHPDDTQDKVAEALGVSRQTVSNYKRSNGNGRH